MSYSLQIDLSGCEWWRGGPINLLASLSRFDATGEHGALSASMCGPFTSPGADTPNRRHAATNGDRSGPVTAACWVGIDVEHPPVETASYRGEIEYPWKGGTATVAFETTCVAANDTYRCIDVEFQPVRDAANAVVPWPDEE